MMIAMKEEGKKHRTEGDETYSLDITAFLSSTLE